MYSISIITVGMNHLAYLKSLLHSLYIENHPKCSFEMIYIDNCSKDDSVKFIRENYPEVKIIENKQPLGFGENNNKGVFASTGKYIAIINPDIVIQKDSLDILLDYAEQHLQAGIIVPQLLNPDHSIQYSVRGFISIKTLTARILSKGKDNVNNKTVNEYLCKDLDFQKTQFVDWAIGAAFFMHRDTFAKLGGFDLDYFLYMEDEDMCLRCWKNNMPVIYCPQSTMIHNHLRGSSKLGKKAWLHIQSMITFFRKHGIKIKNSKEHTMSL